MNSNQHSNLAPRVIISMVATLAIIFIAVLLREAMGAGGWMFIGLIAGIVVIFALSVKFVSFVVHQYVIWTETKTKSQEARNSFLFNMAKIGLLEDGDGGFKPIEAKQITAPKPKELAPADPRKQLLIELCLMTIRSGDYGPASHRLMTADDAQKISKARGGAFADRNTWADASQYAQDNYLVFEKRGGKEQGMMIDSQRVGGETISDLMSVLMRNPNTDAAVNALPANER